MTREQLQAELEVFAGNTERNWKEVVYAVNEYINENPTAEFDSTFPDGRIDRELDSVVVKVGWIKDRMNGKTPETRGSLTKKLRKALGYNV